MSHSRILLILAIAACHHEKKPTTVPQPAADAAVTAKALLRRPVRLAIHAQDLLKR